MKSIEIEIYDNRCLKAAIEKTLLLSRPLPLTVMFLYTHTHTQHTHSRNALEFMEKETEFHK